MLETAERAALVAKLADDKKAEDIVVLDVSEVCTFTDVFVVCTSGSAVQSRAIVGNIQDGMEEQDAARPVVDGMSSTTGWIVLDYGDVVVHVMDKTARDFYQLEALWGDGKVVDWAHAEAGTARA